MKVWNQSSWSTRDLRPLIKFVEKYSPYAFLARLRLFDGPPDIGITGGYAEKVDTSDDAVSGYFSAVTLWLRPDPEFPVKERFVAGKGSVILHDFVEEFIFVLAHELRHVSVFYDESLQGKLKTVDAEEADAEKWALKVLNDYRQSKLKTVLTNQEIIDTTRHGDLESEARG